MKTVIKKIKGAFEIIRKKTGEKIGISIPLKNSREKARLFVLVLVIYYGVAMYLDHIMGVQFIYNTLF